MRQAAVREETRRHRRARRAGFSGVLALLAMPLLAACGPGPEEDAPDADSPSTAPAERSSRNARADSAASVQPWLGSWRVRAHRLGAVSALSEAEAERFHRRTLVLAADRAVSGEAQCAAPAYVAEAVTADRALADYRTTAQALGTGAGAEAWTSVEVRCADEGWTTLGGALLLMDPDRALAPWDGVFFELERVDAPPLRFEATGFEPGWRVEIRGERWIHVEWDYGEQEAYTPVPSPEVDAQTGRLTYHAETGRTTLELVIDPTSCIAGGSGLERATTVTVRVDGRELSGCGSAAPEP